MVALKAFLKKNSSIILLCSGIVGFATTAYLSAKVTPRYLEKVKGVTSKKEKVKIGLKTYLPAIALGGLSTLSLVQGHRVVKGQVVMLTSSLAAAAASAKEYKDKVIEVIGEDKNEEIEKEIAKKHVDDNPVHGSTIVGHGDILCYDDFSSRYFLSDVVKLGQIENEFNRDLIGSCPTATVNELYDYLGLPHVKVGDDYGFDVNKGLLQFTYETKMSEDMKPCVVLKYDAYPLEKW